ncbi:hypothetical protein [Chenggangzhangella methanolivorans]|uniref:Proteic killer suppression protein n=1 Tax=Chenggangzhangella methanolivorans TaxID=1437009 RepID=A0A9E6RBA1_9HYPH|nr:hypothetical protein [Chenggangzhangella methanolivorans]QZO00690.1 hypothetical protein K6K41_03000 [Chenggangzhangella methanolivorans]
MKIGFPNRSVQRLFNVHERLVERFGETLAGKIAGRMAVLAVARNLAALPAEPPIGFRVEPGSANLYGVDLPGGRRLIFTAASDVVDGSALKLSQIEEITVIDIV